MIESLSTTLKGGVWKIIWNRKCKKLTDSSPFPSYDVFALVSLSLL
jgi:hypothetical protein